MQYKNSNNLITLLIFKYFQNYLLKFYKFIKEKFRN